jgi:hypothetical protein
MGAALRQWHQVPLNHEQRHPAQLWGTSSRTEYRGSLDENLHKAADATNIDAPSTVKRATSNENHTRTINAELGWTETNHSFFSHKFVRLDVDRPCGSHKEISTEQIRWGW